nr:response regulator [Haliscomenobacter sp.]
MANKGNILVVEDDLSLGFLLMELLESEGYSVKLARNGQTGLEQFKKQAFDLCILDVMLGDTDGFQVAKQIRLENTTIPFLFPHCPGFEGRSPQRLCIGSRRLHYQTL